MYYDIDQHEIRNIVDKKIKGSFLYMSIALIVTFLTGIEDFISMLSKEVEPEF